MALINIEQTEANVTYSIEGKTIEEVSNIISEYFTTNKYRLESGTKENGVYGIGNDVMRILLGAFSKRYKFQITVNANGNNSVVTLAKAMSGISGGAIGLVKLNKEYKKVTDDLKALFA